MNLIQFFFCCNALPGENKWISTEELLKEKFSNSLQEETWKIFSEDLINYMYMVSMASLNQLIWGKNARSKELQGK